MSVVYLYGFVPNEAQLPAAGLLGVGDVEAEILTGDGFGAVIGRVPGESYGEAALEARARDMEWVAEQGLRHEQVVAWFVDHAVILPSRLLTLFSSDGSLERRMAKDGPRIRAALDRFSGLREWNLKVGYEASRLADHLGEVSEEIARLDREIEGATPGRRYLLEKKRHDLARDQTRAVARDLAGDLLAAIEEHARDSARVAPAEDGAPIVLNAALLLHREQEPNALRHLEREQARLARLGVTVEFTGPWAPYRFMDEPGG